MNIPKLSIITVNYNDLLGLQRTVDSVLNQTWKEFEYIVIDGGSTDGSAEYLKSKSEHINYWVSEEDGGIYNAMNKGIVQAQGGYLLFLNSGDHLYSENVLSENYHYLAGSDLICFDMLVYGENTKTITAKSSFLRFSDLYLGTIPHQTTFIKNQLFKAIGLYDEKLTIVSDWKFFILALFIHHCSYKKIDTLLSVFYADGISSKEDNKLKMRAEREQVLQEYFGAFTEDFKVFGVANYNYRILQVPRFKMLQELEKTSFGRKSATLFFRVYLILFSKYKIKDIIEYSKDK